MDQDRWTEVDRYLASIFTPPDPALDAAVESSAKAGLPEIQVAPNQGKLLHILARAVGARAVLEIGTLGGYSTLWLARALPSDGRLISLEIDPKHADVARANLERAGLGGVAEVRELPVGEGQDAMAVVHEVARAGITVHQRHPVERRRVMMEPRRALLEERDSHRRR